jgi:hypothetical protein
VPKIPFKQLEGVLSEAQLAAAYAAIDVSASTTAPVSPSD